MHSIELPPFAPTLIESTRAIGYSLEAAVADIIDNSIAASAKNIDIFFFPVDEAYIALLDDGIGMNSDQLNSAMQYGSKNPLDTRDSKDLGRFGLGLKTASLSQCRMLTVVTKQKNAVEARRWDIDYVTETGKWSLIILDESELSSIPCIDKLYTYDSATLIVWQNLDRLKAGEINFTQVLGRKIDTVREHLSLVFHRYLSGENDIVKLNISINGSNIVPADPFLVKKSHQAMDDETIVINGQKIVIRPYILPHISKMNQNEIKSLGGKDGLRRQQGFYVYRNKRLLVWGTWFRMMRQEDLSKLARIQVDIPNTLDNLWTLDIKKSSALPPAEVRQNLEMITSKIAEKSKRTWVFRGKREIDDTQMHLWNRMKSAKGGYYYEINRDHPIVEQITAYYPETAGLVEVLLKQIETNLPLNQLYVDLNNDEQILNDQETDEKNITDSLQQLLSVHKCKEEKIQILLTLSNIEPFSQFPLTIEKIMKKVKSDG